MEIFNSKCELCPRECRVDRSLKETGICGMTNEIRLARAALHFWEEPCISGDDGSGAVFFSGCSMRCVFCQNREIASGKIGKTVSINRLAEIFLEQQNNGANNLNLVTPTHYIPQILEALKIAKKNGFCIPVVYNSSGYECVESLRKLDTMVNIYLPDFKYMSDFLADRYSKASGYSEYAKAAIDEMVRQCPVLEFDDNGIMKSGVIVRHMILPGHIDDSKKIIEYLYKTYGDNIYLSIMNQYTPINMQKYPEINRAVTEAEYDDVINFAIKLGVENAFIQEGGTVSESFIPEFDFEGV